MAFNPILSDQGISYAYNIPFYRNSFRESAWGIPVYFNPYNLSINDYGFGGPHYESPHDGVGYNYYNSPNQSTHGNCTWWCCGRLQDALGKNVYTLIGSVAWNANEWYNHFTGTKYTSGSNAVPGDIIVMTDNAEGHVMFIEKIENGVMYISHSAWSTRSYWTGYACRVAQYNVSDIYAGASINIYKDASGYSPYYCTVAGIIHTGEDEPEPPAPITRILKILPLWLRRRKRVYVKIN